MKIMDLSLEGIKKMIEKDHENVKYEKIVKDGYWIVYDDKQNEVCKIDEVEVWFNADKKSYTIGTDLRRYGGGTFGIDIIKIYHNYANTQRSETTTASFGNMFSFMYHKEYEEILKYECTG